jgi:hypothetical protein
MPETKRPRLVIEYEVSDLWFDDESLGEMKELGDAYLLELLAEDWAEVLDGATKRIEWPVHQSQPPTEAPEV